MLWGAGPAWRFPIPGGFGNPMVAGRIGHMADTHLTGAWPINPASPVGFLRMRLGDVVGVPHADAPTKAEFAFMGDATLQGLLDANPDAPNMALAQAMTSMANQMIASAQDIQVDDIRIKTVERANLMLRAAVDLGLGGASSDETGFFEISRVGGGHLLRAPQGTPEPCFGVM